MSRSRTRQKKLPTSGPHPQKRSFPWLRFGPGLLIVAVALWLAWGPLRQPETGSGPRLDRSALSSLPAPPAAPEISWVLAQRESLALTAAQVGKLRRLEARWDRDTRTLRESLTEASGAFNLGMNQRGSQGLNVADLQVQAAPVSDLSRRLAEARRACWSEASTLLTPAQRQRAEVGWSRRWSPARQAGQP